jgi:hypothetical protein
VGSRRVSAGRSSHELPGSAPPCKTWKITSGACVEKAARSAQVRKFLIHLRHPLPEFVLLAARWAQFIQLASEPGKFGLDLGEPVGEPGSFLRWAFADLVYLPGQLADVSFDLVEPVAQFHVFRGGAFIRAKHNRPMPLVGGEPPLLAQHGERLPVRAHRHTITAGMLALGGKPVAGLEPPLFDRRSEIVRDLVIGGPRVAGIRHRHWTSLRCTRPPGPEHCQIA